MRTFFFFFLGGGGGRGETDLGKIVSPNNTSHTPITVEEGKLLIIIHAENMGN